MAKTKHMIKRMNQRGIKKETLRVVSMYGVPEGDRIILNKKGAHRALLELQKISRTLQKATEKGGYVVVSINDALISAWRLDSYNKKLVANDN